MKALIGLGNPGKEFTNTRHNAGFEAIKRISHRLKIPITKIKENCMIGVKEIGIEKVLLAMPLKYMNLTGACVAGILNKFDINPPDALIIVDDVSLELGKIRLREKGSAGGHNGLKSVIYHLNSEDFPRLRIGIGPKPPDRDLSDYVLENFKKSELKTYESALEFAANAAEIWVKEGIRHSMNRFNKVAVK